MNQDDISVNILCLITSIDFFLSITRRTESVRQAKSLISCNGDLCYWEVSCRWTNHWNSPSHMKLKFSFSCSRDLATELRCRQISTRLSYSAVLGHTSLSKDRLSWLWWKPQENFLQSWPTVSLKYSCAKAITVTFVIQGNRRKQTEWRKSEENTERKRRNWSFCNFSPHKIDSLAGFVSQPHIMLILLAISIVKILLKQRARDFRSRELNLSSGTR
jgi:hypothetical protein